MNPKGHWQKVTGRVETSGGAGRTAPNDSNRETRSDSVTQRCVQAQATLRHRNVSVSSWARLTETLTERIFKILIVIFPEKKKNHLQISTWICIIHEHFKFSECQIFITLAAWRTKAVVVGTNLSSDDWRWCSTCWWSVSLSVCLLTAPVQSKMPS